jgi:alpha-amylase/alpha-mannosidase (GH57 family)
MSHPRYLCIHGHFYQPPRENPWLGVVETQDSAAPDHDWNERITRECYAPNMRARVLDNEGRIVNLLNNYAWISFNFGPTLLHWMASAAPEVLRGIVEADRVSRERRGGHGNALAQVYNHVILPLASERDQHTQVHWGIAEFRHRFGREPEGMWLAETAVNTASLEALARAGIRFTVLAPRQAHRWRPIGRREWLGIPGGIDPSRSYLCRLPSGRSIDLFFYDGHISHQVAFERLLDSGERFLERLLRGFDETREHAQLMHLATDGETYGHHHAHGDMALASALDRLVQSGDIQLTNYGEFLERHPPEWEVEIHENSSWSCAHGVERWRSDCGCRSRGDWHQRWRAPVRHALDALKEQVDHLFATRGRECFPDPWAARDGYIAVVLDRGVATVDHFLKTYGHPDLDESQVRDALRLLEMQRDAMAMFTSCGWFFDEISGLEPTQCLHYAARVIQLARHFQRDLEEPFLAVLEQAPSNLPQFGNGRGVWDTLVRPSVVDLERILAHYAISRIYRAPTERTEIEPLELEVLEQEVRARGPSHVAAGRLQARLRDTRGEDQAAFVVIHFGGLDFHAVLRRDVPPEPFEDFKRRLFETFRDGSLADVTTLVAQEFPGSVHRLDDLFRDEQRRIIGIVLQDRLEEYQRVFERLADQDEDLLNRLGRMHYPIPEPLRVAASTYLDLHLHRQIDDLETEGSLDAIRALCRRGQAWGYQPAPELGAALSRAIRATMDELDPRADVPAVIRVMGLLLEAAALVGLPIDLWQAQNRLLDVSARLSESGDVDDALRDAFAQLAEKLSVRAELLGWRP